MNRSGAGKTQKNAFINQTVKKINEFPYPDFMPLKQEVINLQNNQNAIGYHLDGEIVRLSVLSYWSLSRMHQILTSLVPFIPMPPDIHLELTQLSNECVRTLQQFQVLTEVNYI